MTFANRSSTRFPLILLTFGTWALGVSSAHASSGLASYDQHTDAMITAARYEPRGALLRVTNARNGRSVVVRVTDRGPFNGNRVLDLSTGAFRALFGGLGRGTGPISYEVIGGGSSEGTALSSRSGNRYRRSTRRFRRGYRHNYRHHRRHH